MRIGVVSESSTAAKNKPAIEALEKVCSRHTIYNIGMKGIEGEPQILNLDTAFISALALNLKCVDFIIGGCGTGQGYFNSVLQFPGVLCGLIQDDVDAYLFPRINNGNCASLAFNKGYGWAGEVNLEFIFEKLFTADFGGGYPTSRKEPQNRIKERTLKVSACTHKSFAEIIRTIDDETYGNAVGFPGVYDFIKDHAQVKDESYKAFLERKV